MSVTSEQKFMMIVILCQRAKYSIQIPEIATVFDLKQNIIEAGNINPSLKSTLQIKLILCGKLLKDHESLQSLRMDVHSKITLLQITPGAQIPPPLPRHLQTRIIDDLKSNETPAYPLSVSSTSLSPQSRFHGIEILPNLSMQDRARAILIELANDDGVIAVMKKHSWRVGILAELYPEGQVGVDPVCILGLNENFGQRILLRLRTDDLMGFRDILTIRKTLYHELAHNQVGDHNDDFYILMRTIEREVVELDWRKGKSHTIAGARIEQYRARTPSAAATDSASAGVYTLSAPFADGDLSFKSLPASLRAGQAAILRRSEEELEIERQCGCSRSGTQLPAVPDNENDDVCLPCADSAPSTLPLVDASDASSGTIPRSAPPLLPVPSVDTITAPSNETRADSFDSVVERDWSLVTDTVLSSFDEGISVCLSAESTSTPVEKLFSMRDALERMLLQGVSDAAMRQGVIEVLSLLRLIVGNAKELQDKKYKEINTKGKSWARVRAIRGAEEILRVAGFEHSTIYQDKLVYSRNDSGLLYIVFEFLDAALQAVDAQLYS